MNNKKIGTIFLVAVLALAGIGISYAGLTDTISVYGTVKTGSVDLEIEDYSGTWVWKVYADDDETVITNNPDYSVPEDEGMLVSYAKGRDIAPNDPLNGDMPYDAAVEFSNLFPCIDFTADILFHYVGEIPCKVSDMNWDWTGDLIDLDDDGIPETDFITYLQQMWIDTDGLYGMTGGFYRCDEFGNILDPVDEVVVGYQLHYCNYFKLEVTIHLPQDNIFQGLQGSGYVDIGVIQWNDMCDEDGEADIEVIKTVDDPTPYVGEDITYTITAINHGPSPATDIVIEDILPDDVTYLSHVPSHGIFVYPLGQWQIPALAVGESATLDITCTVDPSGTTSPDFTQFCLILDGSGSISPNDWGIMKTGLANAIGDPTLFPHDGTVELTVIQFGVDSYCAQVEIPPTVVTSANVGSLTTTILAMVQGEGWTPMGAGIYLATNTMTASPNFDPTNRQVINLVSDGLPNVVTGPTDLCGTSSTTYAAGKQCAEDARNYMIAQLGMTADQDEFDAEAVGAGTDVSWLRDNMVWPEPGYDTWPPAGPGWVRYVDDYTEFADTIAEKFVIIFQEIENVATRISSDPVDPNPDNDQDSVQIHPVRPL